MPKILGLIWDPPFSGARLHNKFGWTDPWVGLDESLRAINMACGDLYTLEIRELQQLASTRSTFGVERLPDKDGTPYWYNAGEWYVNWLTYGGRWDAWPNGGQLHVGDLLERNGLVNQINSGAIDEVWLATPPVPAPFEGCLLHPVGDATAYTTHDTKIAVPGLNRRCVLHHAQMENWNLVHNYWHRVEAILAHIWTRHVLGYCDWDFGGMSMQDVRTYAQLFTMTHQCRRGEGQVGSCHWMCNSKLGYVGNMDDAVPSGHHLWYDFPMNFPLDLSRKDRYDIVTAKTWEGFSPFAGSVNEYVWQLDHIPRGQRRNGQAPEKFADRWTDWWKYIVDTNDETGFGAESPVPHFNPAPAMFLPNMKFDTPSGTKHIFTIAPHDGDPESGGVYKISADGAETHRVTRKQREHNSITLWTVPASVWKIEGPGWSYDVPGEGVPVQSPRFTPEQLMARLDQVHGPSGTLAGCPKPNRWAWSSNQDIHVFWDGLESQPISSLVDDELSLDEAVNNYTIIYELGAMKKYCGVTPVPTPEPEPEPIPTPIPTPTPPTETVVTAFNKWRDARVLERKLWDEYVKLV